MRRLTSSFIASAMLIAGVNPVKADTTYLFNTTSNGYSTSTVEIFKAVTSSDGKSVDLTKITTLENSGLDDNSFWQDTSQNKLFFFNDTNDKIHAYDIDSDNWNNDVSFTSDSLDNDGTNYTHFFIDSSDISTNASNISTNTSNITTNRNNINNLGEGVANATALTAALTALPQASIDSKFSCGVGTGTYSSIYALGVGCASKVSERVDVNFGGSYVGGGSKDYGNGSLENVAAKAGFVFKLGKINKPTLISMNEKKNMQAQLTKLSTTNSKIQTQNKELQAKVDSFELEKAALVTRLEKLEQIALGNQKNEKTVFSFFNASNLFSTLRGFLVSSN